MFIDRDIGRANGLTIDLEDSFMFWADIDSLVIERASLDDPFGTRQVIQRSPDRFQPSSLAQYQVLLFANNIFISSLYFN